MMYEKSCGFVTFIEKDGVRLYLIIHSSNGDYGFPKGHVEADETEYETAIRELKEETNLEVEIINGFRREIEYKFPNKINVMKKCVYFLGRCEVANIICQENEVSEAVFIPLEKALELLSFDDTRNILKEADNYLNTLVSDDKI